MVTHILPGGLRLPHPFTTSRGSTASGVAARWAKFDRFLAGLSLAIEEEGFGLTRGLTVVDIPAGASAEFVDDADEADGDGDESDDAE